MVFKPKGDESRFNGRKEVKSEVLDYLNKLLGVYKEAAKTRKESMEIPLKLIKGIINDVNKINERPTAAAPIPTFKEEEDLEV